MTERPPNHRDIPTIGREKGEGGDSAEVWKPSITEGLKLTSQQDMCIRMQIWAGYGQQMPSGAVKRAPRACERTYAMWETHAAAASPRHLQKNRKLNWMMIVVAAQKGHCVELTGIMGLKCDKQLTCHIMGANARGCGADTSAVRSPWICRSTAATSGPVGSGSETHRDSSTCTALTGFSPSHGIPPFGPLSKTQPSGLPRAANLHYSLQATFTVRTLQLYFQAH